MDREFSWQIFRKKIRPLLNVVVINYTLILAFVVLGYYFLSAEQITDITAKYKLSYWPYFEPITYANLKYFLYTDAYVVPVTEEIFYRGPFLFLILITRTKHSALRVFYNFLIFFSMIVLNYYWTNYHTLKLPVFMAGLPMYWLVTKTKSLWPSMICHSIFNITLYFFAHFMVYMHFI